MAKRLVDRFAQGDRVAITFGNDRWYQGVVVKQEHPGVWVMTAGQRVWFVTNTRRIRAEGSRGIEDTTHTGNDG